MTRRGLVRGAVGFGAIGVAVAAGLLGPRAFNRLSGDECGATGELPPPSGIPVRSETLRSRFVEGGSADIAVAVPEGLPARGAPVCLCLPGRGGRARDVMGVLRMHDFLAQGVRERGLRPFALVAVDSGESYWHRRAGGEDRMAFLEQVVIPHVQRTDGLGADGAPVLLLGWSMGGYGALLAAERRPDRYRAVAAASPAIWPSRDEQRSAVPDAFDSDADFARNDVIAGAAALQGIPVRVDCGDADPFFPAARRLVDALPGRPSASFDTGCHDVGFWRRIAPAQVDFLSRALSRA
ncbi:MAG: alpha/beta hydrolase-fold protein [Actinomycetota bacterium]